jgi:hypothetical protein
VRSRLDDDTRIRRSLSQAPLPLLGPEAFVGQRLIDERLGDLGLASRPRGSSTAIEMAKCGMP